MKISLVEALISTGYRPNNKSYFSKPFGRNCFMVNVEDENEIVIKNFFEANDVPAVYNSKKINIETLNSAAIQDAIADFEAESYYARYHGNHYNFLTSVERGNLTLIEAGIQEVSDLC